MLGKLNLMNLCSGKPHRKAHHVREATDSQSICQLTQRHPAILFSPCG